MEDEIKECIRVISGIYHSILEIKDCGLLISQAIKSGGKVLIFGNGGSAADAQHFSSELVGRFKRSRKGFPAISLTTDTSVITSISNDFSFSEVFSRQIEALGKKGDVAIGISTSGNSENVIVALNKAKEMGLKTIGLSGRSGGRMKEKGICNILIRVDSEDTQRIQEAHTLIIHLLTKIVEESCQQ